MDRDRDVRILEEAIRYLEAMPDSCKVYITGAYPTWCKQMEHICKSEGLRDVVFMSPQRIINGNLRGAMGVLLVADLSPLPYWQREAIWAEKEIMKITLRTPQAAYSFR